jgi:hypothetical protein
MIPTIFVLAVLGIVGYLGKAAITDVINSQDSGYLVVVNFDPPERDGKQLPGRTLKDVVTVSVSVGSTIFPKQTVTESDWTMVVSPQKGPEVKKPETITVEATQLAGNWLGCKILKDGKVVKQDRRPGPTVVKCSYTAVD